MTDDSDSTHSGYSSDAARRRAEAVSAYVDGVASDDERALVEADPALQSEVALLGEIRDSLREVPRLDDGLRDRLLGAALAEFDSPTATAAAGTAPPPPGRRYGGGRWLAAAAVVAVVATAGIALAIVIGSGDDDSSPNAGQFQEFRDEDNTGAKRGGTTGDASADELPEPSVETEGEAPTATSSAGSASAATTATQPPNDLALENAGVTDKESLVDWVLDVRDGQISADRAGETLCGTPILGTTDYYGDEVVVAIEGSQVVARDADDCGIVLQADAP